MNLIPFLEAVEEYQMRKRLKKNEKRIRTLEAATAFQVGRVFRQQGEIIIAALPEVFDAPALTRAADKAELESYPFFKDVLISSGIVAAQVGIRELFQSIGVKDGEVAFSGFKISFTEFDNKALKRLQDVAGAKIKTINDVTRKQIHDILVDGFEQKKSYSAIAKDIKDRFDLFSAPAPQKHIRNRAELVSITETRDAYETSKYDSSQVLESHGWELEKHWNNMGDDRVSDGCRENTAAGWIDNNAAFPSGHQYSPRFPGCRCNVTRRVKKRSAHSHLPVDRWIATRVGDTVTVTRNPKYA